MAVATDPKLEEIRQIAGSAGSSSSSRSSSTCTAARARSSCPAANLDDLVDRRRGIRGLRRRRDRPGAERPGHRSDARPRQLHAGAVAAEPRAVRLRRHGRGRAVAVLPAHDPAPSARAGEGARLRVQARARARVLPRPPRDDGSIEIADAADTLEKPCYDMAGLTRHYDFLTTVSRYCNELGWGNYANDHEDANGQFEQNFDLRRRARQLRPRDLLPLHGAHARRAARDDRDVHAEAVHAA